MIAKRETKNNANKLIVTEISLSLIKSKILALAWENIQASLVFLARLFVSL